MNIREIALGALGGSVFTLIGILSATAWAAASADPRSPGRRVTAAVPGRRWHPSALWIRAPIVAVPS